MPRETVLLLSLAGVPALVGQVIANVCGGTMHAGGVGGTGGRFFGRVNMAASMWNAKFRFCN